MSLSFSVYLIDVEHLHRLFGCHDDQMRDRLLGLLREDGKWDEERVEQAICEIVMGASSASHEPEAYAAALEILCLDCGELLPSDALSSMHPAATALLGSIPGLLSDAPLPATLPGPPSRGFPTPLFISRTNAHGNLLQLPAMAKTKDDTATDWLSDAVLEYRGWLERSSGPSARISCFSSDRCYVHGSGDNMRAAVQTYSKVCRHFPALDRWWDRLATPGLDNRRWTRASWARHQRDRWCLPIAALPLYHGHRTLAVLGCADRQPDGTGPYLSPWHYATATVQIVLHRIKHIYQPCTTALSWQCSGVVAKTYWSGATAPLPEYEHRLEAASTKPGGSSHMIWFHMFLSVGGPDDLVKPIHNTWSAVSAMLVRSMGGQSITFVDLGRGRIERTFRERTSPGQGDEGLPITDDLTNAGRVLRLMLPVLDTMDRSRCTAGLHFSVDCTEADSDFMIALPHELLAALAATGVDLHLHYRWVTVRDDGALVGIHDWGRSNRYSGQWVKTRWHAGTRYRNRRTP